MPDHTLIKDALVHLSNKPYTYIFPELYISTPIGNTLDISIGKYGKKEHVFIEISIAFFHRMWIEKALHRS